MMKRLLSLMTALLLLFSTPFEAIAIDSDHPDEYEFTEETAVLLETGSCEASESETSPSTEPLGTDSVSFACTEISQTEEESANLASVQPTPRNANTDFSVNVVPVSGATLVGGDWVWNANTNKEGHRFIFGVDFNTSGNFSIAAGDLEIWIPKEILKNRYNAFAQNLELSVPHKDEMEPDEDPGDIEFVWEDGVGEHSTEIHIFNIKEIPSGENGRIEVAYATSKGTINYHDMAESEPFYAKYACKVNGVAQTPLETNKIPVYINTQVNIKSTSKKKPDYYTEWQSEWGEAPADADQYAYLLWRIESDINLDSCQPYSFQLDDTILSCSIEDWQSNHGADVYAYRFNGQNQFSLFSGTHTASVDNQTLFGLRSDFIITRHAFSNFAEIETIESWEVTNQITATVTPKDGLDASSTAVGQRQYVWHRPHFIYPNGAFNVFKRGDGGYRLDDEDWLLFAPGLTVGNYSRYDLDAFVSGEVETLPELDYAVWLICKPYYWTLEEGADRQDPNNYAKKKVKLEIVDEELTLLNPDGMKEENNGGTVSEQDMRELTPDDYQIDYITFSYTGNDAVFDTNLQDFRAKQIVFENDDILTFYGKFAESEEWVEVASRNMRTGVNTINETYAVSMNDTVLDLQDNCYAFKLCTESRHYYNYISAVPNISLKRNEALIAFCSDGNGDPLDDVALRNTAHGSIAKTKDSELDPEPDAELELWESDYDYIQKTERSSSLDKTVTGAKNNPKQRNYRISWTIEQKEIKTSGSGKQELVPQNGGVFYDLLPEGGIFDANSVSVKTGKGYLSETAFSVRQTPNYKGSGRTLLTVTVTEPGDCYTLLFDTVHDWDNIRYYGTDVYNPVAYETGNFDIGNGYPDNGGRKDLEDQADWNNTDVFQESEYTEFFTNLDPDSDAERFIYAEEHYDISAVTTASAGLKKQVLGTDSSQYSYNAWTTIDGGYSYCLRYMNSANTRSSNLILFDTFENYTPTGTEGSDWHGTLESIDVSQLSEMGIAPVVYVYTGQGALDLSGSAQTGALKNNDLANELVWQPLTGDTDLASVKAIAIDMRKNTDGELFILEEGRSVSVYLYFTAPAAADDEIWSRYPETYNNVYMWNTVWNINNEAVQTLAYINQDYTTVRFKVIGDVRLHKVSEENAFLSIPGIKFRLTGTSYYGTEVDQIKKTDRRGNLSFQGVERGSYVLQEYESTDDWLLDPTEHSVVIGYLHDLTPTVSEAEDHYGVWIDGVEMTDMTLTLSDAPRIHGDVSIHKIPESLPDPSGDAVQATPAYQPGDGIPNTVFRLSGTSDYGNEVQMIRTTSAAGHIVFHNLELGTYVLEELSPNPNYVINTTKWIVTIHENGQGEISLPTDANDLDRLSALTISDHTYQIQNENRYWNAMLYKQDSETHVFLEGASFRLTGTSALETYYDVTATTNDQGMLMFEHLEKGTYRLVETVAPTGVDEDGQSGGSLNYQLDPTERILTVSETGQVTISGATKTENGELVLQNDRARDGKVVVRKFWDDYDPENRPTPKLHLSTSPNIPVERLVTVNVNWQTPEEGDSYDPADPCSITVYIEKDDGTLVGQKTFQVTPGEPMSVKLTALINPALNYWVWVSTNGAYGAVTTQDNSNPMQPETDGAWSGEVMLKKLTTTTLMTGSNLMSNNRIPFNITSFQRAYELPDPGYQVISVDGCRYPAFGWCVGTDYYWYCDADIVYTNPNSAYMFSSRTELANIDLEGLDTSKTENMDYMFYNCVNLTTLDLSSFDTSSVTNMSYMFACDYPSQLEEIIFGDQFTAENVENMSNMFFYCVSLKTVDLSGIKESKVEDLSFMFSSCSALESVDLSNFVGNSVTSTNSMFTNCSKLTGVDLSSFSGENVSDMRQMFQFCSSLTRVELDAFCSKNLSSTRSMFGSCSSLTTVSFNHSDGRNTIVFAENGTMYQMFMNCFHLTTVDLTGVNTEKVTDMRYMFYKCWNDSSNTPKLTTLDLSSFSIDSVTDTSNMFGECQSLHYIYVSNLWNSDEMIAGQHQSGASISSSDMFYRTDVPNYSGSVVDGRRAYYGTRNDVQGYLTYKDPPLPAASAAATPGAAVAVSGREGKAFELAALAGPLVRELVALRASDSVAAPASLLWKSSPAAWAQNPLREGDVRVYDSEDDKWDRVGDFWVYTFEVIGGDDEKTLYLFEEPMEGYTSPAMESYVVINDPEVTKYAEITNYAEDKKTGALSLSKTVLGSDTTQRFAFTVTLTGSRISGVQIFGETVFTDGVATVLLGHNETICFEGIPEGTSYSITEATPKNFSCSAEGASGTIEEDETASAAFTNTKDSTERETVDLTLKKEVAGEFDPEQAGSYPFIVLFTNLEPDASYSYTSSDGTSSTSNHFTSDGDGNAVLPLSVQAGESVLFSDLPVEATYQITEEGGEYISAYRVEDENDLGSIASPVDCSTTENESLTTAQETVDAGEDVTVTFVNTLHHTGDLILRKQVLGDPPASEARSFTFTLEFSGLAPEATLDSNRGRFVADVDGVAEKTFFLRDGESLIIEGIPVGVRYRVTEDASNFRASYAVNEIDGETTQTVYEGANPGINTALQTWRIVGENDPVPDVISDGKTAEIVFTNYFVRPGVITLSKRDSSDQALEDVAFRLEYAVDGEDIWQPVRLEDRSDEGIYEPGACSSAGLADGVLRTDASGVVRFEGLSTGSTVRYRLIELETKEGLTLLKDPIEIGSLPEERSFTSEVERDSFLAGYDPVEYETFARTENPGTENEQIVYVARLYHIYYRVVNSSNFEIPETGGPGFVGVALASALAGLFIALGLLLIQSERKRSDTQ